MEQFNCHIEQKGYFCKAANDRDKCHSVFYFLINDLKLNCMKIPKALFFNSFTKAFLGQVEDFPFLNRRLTAVMIDFMYSLAVFFPLWALVVIPAIFIGISLGDSFQPNSTMPIVGFLPYSLYIFVLINKDFFHGRSIAKRIKGYQVVDYKTEKVATEMQCMIRNLTVIIWPIEVLFLIISRRRRLGDILANTEVIDADELHPESILEDFEQINRNKDRLKLIYSSILFSILFSLIATAIMII